MQLLRWLIGTQHEECPSQLASRRLTQPASYFRAVHRTNFTSSKRWCQITGQFETKGTKYFTTLYGVVGSFF